MVAPANPGEKIRARNRAARPISSHAFRAPIDNPIWLHRQLLRRPWFGLADHSLQDDDGQNLGRQLAALHQQGCDPIFQDKASGKSVRGRPRLDKAIKALGPSDVLVLAVWDRATRSMLYGIAIMERVLERGATIKGLAVPRLVDDHRQGHPGLPIGLGSGRARAHPEALQGRPQACQGARGPLRRHSTIPSANGRRGAWLAGRVRGRLPGCSA